MSTATTQWSALKEFRERLYAPETVFNPDFWAEYGAMPRPAANAARGMVATRFACIVQNCRPIDPHSMSDVRPRVFLDKSRSLVISGAKVDREIRCIVRSIEETPALDWDQRYSLLCIESIKDIPRRVPRSAFLALTYREGHLNRPSISCAIGRFNQLEDLSRRAGQSHDEWRRQRTADMPRRTEEILKSLY